MLKKMSLKIALVYLNKTCFILFTKHIFVRVMFTRLHSFEYKL